MIRIYFILAEENLFHPYYVSSVLGRLDKKNYKPVGITVLKEHYKHGFIRFLIQQFNLWGFWGFLFISINSVVRRLIDNLLPRKNLSVKNIAKDHHIPYIEIKKVNSGEHLSYLRKKMPDIIVSSSGQFFKEELLKLPKIACINRHSALLPKYGGVLPVFWAMYNGEKEIGVSIHYMTKEIDKGDILYQIPIKNIEGNSLFKNYVLAFHESVEATIKALKNVSDKRIYKKYSSSKESYFSIPLIEEMRQLRKRNKSFSFEDIALYNKMFFR